MRKDRTLAEKDLRLKIVVEDQNDNAPVFNIQMTGFVDELSDEGTWTFFSFLVYCFYFVYLLLDF